MKKQTNMDTVLARVRGNRRAQRVASALACLVVFVTLWRLTLPAITRTNRASTSVKVDGEWHEYTLDLSGHPGWTGLVEEVWFDPTELHFTDVLIDSMAFIPTNSL